MQLSSGPQRTALAAICFSRRRRQRTPVLFRTELALYSDTPAGQGLIDLRFACLLLCQRTLGRMGARPVALGSVRYFPCCMAAADHLSGRGLGIQTVACDGLHRDVVELPYVGLSIIPGHVPHK
jgi:hypothetical protein